MLTHKESWIVRIGIAESLRFTYQRPAGDPLQLLGSVSRGARIGALAVMPDGTFVQVNGDHVSPLNATQIQRAIERAKAFKPRPKVVLVPMCGAEKPPTVVVKRRRVVEEFARPAAAGVDRTTR